MSPAPVPAVLVTGALGSGKTTLIRAWMGEPDMARTALIINEFGEIGLDHLLVASAIETTLLMENGCLCCSLRGDLVDTIEQLFEAVTRGALPPFDRILIETTGLADPVPIVRDLAMAPSLKGRVRLAAVATAVDGVLGKAALSDDATAVSQVAQADICFLTKADLADPLALDGLMEAVGTVNPIAEIRTVSASAPPRGSDLFGGLADLAAPAPHKPHGTDDHGHHHHDDDHHHPHAHSGVENFSVELAAPLSWPRLRDWLDHVYSLHAAHILRMKGILAIDGERRPLLVQGVGPLVMPLEFMDAWPDGRELGRLVLITRGLPAANLAASFRAEVLGDTVYASGRAPVGAPG